MPPRPIRPKHDQTAPEGSDGASDSKSAKRKAVSTACIPCRKRKSKCDGAVPACSTCIAVYRSECSYDADSDHRRKAALKRDLQSLQQQNDALDVIVASLRSLPEPDAIALLHSLRSDTNPDVIASALRTNVQLPENFGSHTLEGDFAEQCASPTGSSYTHASFPAPASREHSGEDPRLHLPISTPSQAASGWFHTPQDADFVDHLFGLYFCWIHPFYHFFSQQLLISDMERGRTDFCSALLVNAIASFACHYSDRASARTEPSDPLTAGDHFFAHAKTLLDRDENPCLTTVQALGVMSVRETSAGRDSNGYQLAGRCVRMALELGLHLSAMKSAMRPQESEARKVTFWGVFNLETICAVGFGRLSQLPRAAADIETPVTTARFEAQTWRPYEDTNLAMSPSAEQPARTLLFQEQFSKLSELASEMVNTFYAPKERFTSRRLAATYAQYRQWFQDLPNVFRLEHTSLPHVLVLHMYYYGCVLHLFRPYIKLDLRGANLYPRDTCTFCANEISALMNALRAMYGLRRVCLAITNLLLSASTIHLLNLPSEPAAAHLSQALHDLEAMSVNHRFAARAIDITRSLSSKWNIALPEGAAGVAVYRLLGQQKMPSPSVSSFFAASIPRGLEHPRSGDSSASSTESPFGPPSASSHTPQNAQLQQTSHPTLYGSDMTSAFEQNSAQSVFWTPFPGQGMPAQRAGFDIGLMNPPPQPPSMDQQHQHQRAQHHWGGMGDIAAPPPEAHGRQQSAPARLDENMGGYSDWSWQS